MAFLTQTVPEGGDNLVDELGNFLVTEAGIISTTTAIVSSLNPSPYAAMITFTATVTPDSGGPATGIVGFYDDVALLGWDTLNGAGQGSFSTAFLLVGSHPITANYEGDGTYDVSTSSILTQIVNSTGSFIVFTTMMSYFIAFIVVALL